MPNLIDIAIKIHNAAHRLVVPPRKPAPASLELKEIACRAEHFPSDIADHLSTIFSESLSVHPRLIVELGVRSGESRFALERVARASQACLVSVDIEDCSTVCGESPKWFFLRDDDVDFGRKFSNWCHERAIEPKIDVLFIDTSHIYDHTVEEIREWFPHLNTRCKVIFHDTNLRNFTRRSDGTILRSWNNHRGVIRAIEEYLGAKVNERRNFVTTVNDWMVRHWAHCNGLTILERAPAPMPKSDRP
jgi:cephalosporin hydroxylase